MFTLEDTTVIALLEIPRSKDGQGTMTDETFGSRLKRLREEAGLTQQTLADGAGMHRFGIAKLERDEYGPSWATVQALAKALGLTCSAFEGTVEPNPDDKPPRAKGRPRKTPAAEEPASEGEVKPARKRGKKEGG